MALTLANKITIGRIVCVPVFIIVLLYYTPERDYLRWWALGIFLSLEVLDIVDGYIARRFYQKTRAGAILDPFADKLLLISAFIILYALGEKFAWPVRFPLWLVVVFVARDIILILGGLLVELKHSLLEVRSNAWGKITAFLQAVCVAVVLLQWDRVSYVWWVALAAAVVSWVIYMKEGIKALNDAHA